LGAKNIVSVDKISIIHRYTPRLVPYKYMLSTKLYTLSTKTYKHIKYLGKIFFNKLLKKSMSLYWGLWYNKGY